MDRLNFRKKMAVFISLVMILQVVLCNVGYAAVGRIEFDKTNLQSFANNELIYANGVKIVCNGLTKSYNGTNTTEVNDFTQLSEDEFRKYHFEASVTDSISIEVVVPTEVDNSFIGLDIAGTIYNKESATNDSQSNKYTFNYTYLDSASQPVTVALKYDDQTSQTVEPGDVGINIENAQNGKVYYSIGDANNFKEISYATYTLRANTELNTVTDNTIIYLKAIPNDGKQLDTNNQQNIIRYDGEDHTIDTTSLQNGTYCFNYSCSKTYNIKITFDGSSSENDTPLGLTIGDTSIITNGNFVTSDTQKGITVENNILKYNGLMIENNGDNNFTISVCISKTECSNNIWAETVKIADNEMAVLNLGAFTFTGNGNVDIRLENKHEESELSPDCIVNIGANNTGYSIYDTDGVELNIEGNWESAVYLAGGIYSAKSVMARDISKLIIGKKYDATNGIIEVSESIKIVEGASDKNVNIDIRTNIEMNTSGVALKNINYFKATEGGNVKIESSYSANIVDNVRHVFVGYGGVIKLTATNGTIGIENPNDSNRSVLYGYYDGDNVSSENQSFVIVGDDREDVCSTTNAEQELYKLSYENKSFYLSSKRDKLVSIGWDEIIENEYGSKFEENGIEITKDLKYYQKINDTDELVINGHFNVQAAKGIVRKRFDQEKNETVDEYYFEKGTEIKFELVPNPGYEYDENTFSFNGGNGTGGAVEGEMGVYSYTMGDRPVHISCAFKKANNTVTDNSEFVSNSSVELSDESTSKINGALALSIVDTQLSGNSKTEMTNKLNDTEYIVENALDLNLNQEIDKIKTDGTSDGKWKNPLTELGENVTITLGLDSELQGKGEYTIIREHSTGTGESATTEYETITPTVDRTNNTITFETDKFSTYAIAYKGTRNVPVNPPVSNPDPTPAPTPKPEPTPTPTPAPTEEAKPSMAPVSEDVTTSVSKEVESVVQEIVKGTDTTVVDEDTASKIKEAAEQGKEINTEVVAETVEKEKVDTKEAKAIEEKVKSLQSVVENVTNTIKKITSVAQFINVEILIKADGEKLGNLKELKEPIKLKIDIPDNLKKSSRKFFVLRLHDGIVEKLESIMNADGTLTFITDKFSTYALAYEDTVEVEKTVGKTKIGSTTRTSTSVTIPWSKVAGATKYRVYYRLKGAKEFKRVGDTTSLKYTVKGLKSATTYEFAIKAYGYGKWSKIYTTRVTTTAPAKVSTPVVKSNAKGKVVLSYKKVTGATGYQVYIAKGNGSYKRFACGKLTTVTKSKLTRGVTYKFKVRAYKKVGDNVYYGAYSSAKVVKVK